MLCSSKNVKGTKMKTRTKALFAVGTFVAMGLSVGVAAPAFAVACSNDEMCGWNNGSLTGQPDAFLILGTPTNGTAVNVPDNITSSGFNAEANGWCGSNVVNVVYSVVVAKFPHNVSVSLTGTSANNVIDDMHFVASCSY
jgi:hypothetical protein